MPILDVAMQVIEQIDHPALQAELAQVYRGPEALGAVFAAHEMFEVLTAKSGNAAKRELFCANYPQTHLSSQSVGGLIVRLLGERAYDAAEKMSHVIAEDTGVEGRPHNELYADFAGAVTGDSQWRLPELVLLEVEHFARYVQTSRTKDTIPVGIATTFASEVFNTGEYTHFSTMVGDWLTKELELAKPEANKAAIYVNIHAGATELDHALNAYEGLKLYHEARGSELDSKAVGTVFRNYLTNVEQAYTAITKRMTQTSENALRLTVPRIVTACRHAEIFGAR